MKLIGMKRQSFKSASMIKTLGLLMLLSCPFIPTMANAKNVGVIGEVFPVEEPDLLVYMKAKAAQMMQDGEWQAKMSAFQNQARQALQHLPPVAESTTTTVARTWTLDPTFTLHHTLYGANGQVIASAGTTINPLDKVQLNETLIFFDARDKAQVAWANAFLAKTQGQVKPILVGGDWIDLSKAWQRQVYFDVNGTISHRLQITHVPSVVTQQGHFLQIQEEVAS